MRRNNRCTHLNPRENSGTLFQTTICRQAICSAIAALAMASTPALAERTTLPKDVIDFVISSENRGDGWSFSQAALDNLTIQNEAPHADFWDLQSDDTESALQVDKNLTLNGGSLKTSAMSTIDINENLTASQGGRLYLGKSNELTVYGAVDFTDSSLTLAEGSVFHPYNSDITFKDSVLTSEGSTVSGASSLTFTNENTAYACTGEDNYLVVDKINVKNGATMTVNSDATLGISDSHLTVTNATLVNNGIISLEDSEATFDGSTVHFRNGTIVADSVTFTGAKTTLVIGNENTRANGMLKVSSDTLDLSNTSVVISNGSSFAAISENRYVTFGDLHVGGGLLVNEADDSLPSTMILTGKTVLSNGKIYAQQIEARDGAILYSTGLDEISFDSPYQTNLSQLPIVIQDHARLTIENPNGISLGDVWVGDAGSLRTDENLLAGHIRLNGTSADTAANLTASRQISDFTGTIQTEAGMFGTVVSYYGLNLSSAVLIADGTLTIQSTIVPHLKLGQVDVAGVLDLTSIRSFGNTTDDGHVITLKGTSDETGIIKLYAKDSEVPALNIRATTKNNQITVIHPTQLADFKNIALEVTEGSSLTLSVDCVTETSAANSFHLYASLGDKETVTNQGELHLAGQNVMFSLGSMYSGNGVITFDDATGDRLINTTLDSFQTGARFDIGSAANPQTNVFWVMPDNTPLRLGDFESDRLAGNGLLKASAIELTDHFHTCLGLWATESLIVSAKDATIGSLIANDTVILRPGSSLAVTGHANIQLLTTDTTQEDLDATASALLFTVTDDNVIDQLHVTDGQTLAMSGQVKVSQADLSGTFYAGDAVTLAGSVSINSANTPAQAYLPSSSLTASSQVRVGNGSTTRGFLHLGAAQTGGSTSSAPSQDWNSSLAKLSAHPLLSSRTFNSIGCLNAYDYDLHGASILLGNGTNTAGTLTVASDAALIVTEATLRQTDDRTYSTGFKGNLVNSGTVFFDVDRIADRTSIELVDDGYTVTEADGAQWLAANLLYRINRSGNRFFFTYDDLIADQFLDTVDETFAQRIKAHAASGRTFDSTRSDGLGFVSKVLKDVVIANSRPPIADGIEMPSPRRDTGEAEIATTNLMLADAIMLADDASFADANTNDFDRNSSLNLIDHSATADRIGRTLNAADRFAVLGGAVQNSQLAASLLATQIGERAGLKTSSAARMSASEANTLWASPVYNKTRSNGFKASAYSYGIDTDLYGLAFGGDVAVTDGVRLGVAFSGGTGDSNTKGALMKTKNDFDFYSGSLYAITDVGSVTVLTDLDYTWLMGDVKQVNNITTLKSTVKSDITSLGVSAKRVFETNGGVNVTPYAGVRVNRLHIKDFNVKDADGGTVIKSDAKTQYYATVPMGVQVSKNFELAKGYVKPSLDLGLVTTVGSRHLNTRMTYTGLGDTKATSEVRDRTAFTVKFGVNGEVGNFGLGVGYAFVGSENITNHQVYGNLKYRF